ncbi:MAG: alpha-ketoglutarate-dependent dioxygenase AlkB [Candidatus Polarisedimenticolia bacterium]
MRQRAIDPVVLPEGFVYRAGFIDSAEETELIARVEELPFQQIRMRGVVARRTVVHFGWDYGYDGGTLRPSAPIPPFLLHLRERCTEEAGLSFDGLQQALVTRYPAGAGIGWHRDAPMFGPVVAGVSLGAPARFRLRRTVAGRLEVVEAVLEPRSLYLLSGAARSSWQHTIPAMKTLRYSITFRQVRGQRSW